jgi:hypothetical protein
MDKLQRILLTSIIPLINNSLAILVEVHITNTHSERDTIPLDPAKTILNNPPDMVDKLPGRLLLLRGEVKDDNHTAQDVEDFLGFLGEEVALPFFRVLDQVEPDGDLDVVVGVGDGEGVGCAGEGVAVGWFNWVGA